VIEVRTYPPRVRGDPDRLFGIDRPRSPLRSDRNVDRRVDRRGRCRVGGASPGILSGAQRRRRFATGPLAGVWDLVQPGGRLGRGSVLGGARQRVVLRSRAGRVLPLIGRLRDLVQRTRIRGTTRGVVYDRRVRRLLVLRLRLGRAWVVERRSIEVAPARATPSRADLGAEPVSCDTC